MDEKQEPFMNILADAEPETESMSIRGPKNTVAQVTNYLVVDVFKLLPIQVPPLFLFDQYGRRRYYW